MAAVCHAGRMSDEHHDHEHNSDAHREATTDHPSAPDENRARTEFGRAARGAAGVALGLGLAGVQSLMRPDDVPPGRGRQAYRLAFGGLTAASSMLTAGDLPTADEGRAEPDPDALAPRTVRILTLATTVGGGVASAALFHPRVRANWWGDRILASLGVTHTRTAGALIAVSATAGVIVFSDRMEHATAPRIEQPSTAGTDASDPADGQDDTEGSID